MKLYTKPGACSTAVHIDLAWTGQPFEVEVMDAESMKAPAFRALNPAGSVPVLVDGDFVLTQNAAIVGYIADTFPQAGLGGDASAPKRPAGWPSSIPTCTRRSSRCSARPPSSRTRRSSIRSRPPRGGACAGCSRAPTGS